LERSSGASRVCSARVYTECACKNYTDSYFRYEKAFVDFFEDELVRFGYDWKQVVEEYLFSGKEPVFNSIIADCMSHIQT